MGGRNKGTKEQRKEEGGRSEDGWKEGGRWELERKKEEGGGRGQ